MRIAALGLLAAIGVALGRGGERELHAGVRGASLGLFASDPDYDYAAMLDEMRARGASDVLVVYRLMQDDVHATELALDEGASPSLATLRRTLAQARARGMRVGSMPIVGLRARGPGQWRGRIDPDDVQAWFESYGAHLREAARVAEAAGAARLVIGSELNALERHEARWRELATDARRHFGGELVYSANWDRYRAVRFWDAVDGIGVSAYFRMHRGDPRAQWSARLDELHDFAAGRPVLITEVGYPAHAQAARFPWDETREAPPAPALQAELLGAFCEAYERRAGAGYYVWNWFGVGGPRDTGYSLRGKPAAARFERCMEESER